MKENTQIIEINGVKLQVDMRYAKRIEEITVGSRVKVLRKTYSENYEVLHGVIIGFEPFEKLPTIIVAAAKVDYSTAQIEFIYYNAKTEGVEIVVAHDDDLAALDKNDFVAKCDREIDKKRTEIAELENRKQFFLAKFGIYWNAIDEAVADATA